MTTTNVFAPAAHKDCTSPDECQDKGHIVGYCSDCHQPVYYWEAYVPMLPSILLHAEHLFRPANA